MTQFYVFFSSVKKLIRIFFFIIYITTQPHYTTYTMYGLKEWAMEVDYNASKKTRIQQENDDVRDETIHRHALTITKIMKRLNDLESIVQDQENLLSEQSVIIKRNNDENCMLKCIVQDHKNLLTEHLVIIESNNEKICVLQHIVEEQKKLFVDNIIAVEHIVAEQKQILEETNDVMKVELNKVNIVEDKIDYLQLEVYKNKVTWAAVCIITDIFGVSRGDHSGGPLFRRLKYDLVIPFLEKIAHIIDVKWNVDEFIKNADELFQKVDPLIAKDTCLDCEVSLLKLLEFLDNSSCKVRKMFVTEEKILRSYVLLKPLMKTVYESYDGGVFKQLLYMHNGYSKCL